MVTEENYVPARGDVIWINFDPQVGHEQSGRRPAVVLSPVDYNRTVGLGLMCPITTRSKGYPWEVALDQLSGVQGVVLADQVKSLDWRRRNAAFMARLDDSTTSVILARARTLLG